MPCPTCDHTLQSLGQLNDGRGVFWCPRCGTLRFTRRYEVLTDEAPMLPPRVLKLIDWITNEIGATGITAESHRLGVTEACMLPSDRGSIMGPATTD